MYLTLKNYKEEYHLLHKEYCTIHSSKAKVQAELRNFCEILENNNKLGNDFVAIRKAKDASNLLVFTSHYATVKSFLDIIIYMPSKRLLPVFKLTGRCTITAEKKDALVIDYINMEEEFRNNGIGTIALNYVFDWAERESKSCILVDLFWINLTAFESSLKGFLSKFEFKTFYLANSSVIAEKLIVNHSLVHPELKDEVDTSIVLPNSEKDSNDFVNKTETDLSNYQKSINEITDVMSIFDLLPSTSQFKLLDEFREMVNQAFDEISKITEDEQNRLTTINGSELKWPDHPDQPGFLLEDAEDRCSLEEKNWTYQQAKETESCVAVTESTPDTLNQ